jgi:predicted DNA-binding transcriptional regulator AlpA
VSERLSAPELITIEELAALCRTPVKTVRNHWVYRQDFPRAYKPGKRLFWDRQEVVQWLRTQQLSEPGRNVLG